MWFCGWQDEKSHDGCDTLYHVSAGAGVGVGLGVGV